MTPEQTRFLDALNDFQQFRRAHLDAAANLDLINRQVGFSYHGIYDQMERMLGQIRQYRDLVPSVQDLSKLMGFTHANQRWEHLINQATASSKIVEDLSRVHRTWLANIDPLHDTVGQVQAVSRMSLIEVTSRLAVAERYLDRIDFDQLHTRLSFPETQLYRVYESINGMIGAYESLANSISTYSEFTRFPAYTLPGATKEILASCYTLEQVSTAPSETKREQHDSEIEFVADLDEDTSECERLLREVDPNLAKLLRGSQDAIKSDNADRARHVLSSLRELWSHLLRLLAPNNAVRSWTQDEEHFHDGRPTRRARILYVYRDLADPPLTDFILQDASALMTLFNIFNRVHELNPDVSDRQLHALLWRTCSALTYILQICKG